MITRMVEWVRRKAQGEPYNPAADPIARMLTDAKDRALQEAEKSHQALRQNRLEAALLHDRLKAQNGGPGARRME